ncbi:MAG: response regulator [Myxococcales bacterium]
MRYRRASHGGLVLVVDDDPDFRQFVTAVLASEHLFSVEAADGEVALEIVAHVRPDLITLDLEMPRLTGWHMLEALRRDKGLASIPVFVISGLSLADSRITPGSVAWLCKKPLDVDTFVAKLRRRFPEAARLAPTLARAGGMLHA